MPSIRQRLGNFLLREEKARLQEVAELLTEAYRMGPRIISPENLVARIGEFDSRLLDLLRRQIMQTSLFGQQGDETARLQMVDVSRNMYDNDPVTSEIVSLWTDFGFGLHVDITPRDEAAREVWAEFWTADRNNYVLGEAQLHSLSVDVLNDGDMLLLFFISTISGRVTIRTLPTDQLKGGNKGNGIICDPTDDKVPLYYRREYSVDGEQQVLYYPDWRASAAALRKVKAETLEDGKKATGVKTVIKAMLVAHNRRQLRGWPLLTTGFEWSKAYKQFLEDRAAINRAATMFLDKIKIQGGQRAIDNMAARLQSSAALGVTPETNPRPVAGSTWLENEAATRERFDMGTGAGDAEKDGAHILAMAGISARIFIHWLGSGESFRLATATAMETPTLRAFTRYQIFWASVWRDVARIVLSAAQLYAAQVFTTTEVDVSQDALVTASAENIQKIAQVLNEAVDRGLVEEQDAKAFVDQLLRIAAQSLGVKDIDAILGIPITQEPEPEVPPGQEPPDDGAGESFAEWIKSYNSYLDSLKS